MTSEMPSTGERAFGSAEMGTLSVLCVASPGAHCCWNPSLKTKNSSKSVFLKLWRPFPNLSRRVCGGSGSFKEYPGLFSAPGVQGGESSSRTRRVTALVPQAAPHRAGRESPLLVPGVFSCSQRGQAGQQTLGLDKGATPGSCFPWGAAH